MNDERRANSEQRRKCVLDKSILHCRFIYGKDLLFRIGVWKPRKISLYWFITPICGVILLKESTVWKWRERNPRGISLRRSEREKWEGEVKEGFISYASSRMTLFLHHCSPIANLTWSGKKWKKKSGKGWIPCTSFFPLPVVVDPIELAVNKNKNGTNF